MFNLEIHAKKGKNAKKKMQKKLKMHVQFENSCKKWQRRIFNFEINAKKGKNENPFFWIFFAFII